ncbi:uncharacterized protein [Cicer arietinum]|uniref:NKAP family protein UM04995 n=1 Tax=Cicer arietinum TaxID=3827 RepID=A0A1S2YX18_CICAR|nr:NKAP family protein UM04995 [Cicer arietinum]XP_027193145.1 NKAP family protein UM04995 [Cicer arietinum]
MSRRDSDSNRRHSRFDRESSPKRHRRDGKHDRDRVTTGSNGSHRHQPHAFHNSNSQAKDADNKPNDHYETPKPESHPTQHEERGNAGQVGRSSGQTKAGERGWWKDLKNQHNEREEISLEREQRDGKSQAKTDDNTSQRRGGFSERKVDQPPTSRKRPAFREKKIPVDSGDVNLAATMTVKSRQFEHPPEWKERNLEKSSNPYHSDDRAPYKDKTGRDGFPSRERRRGNGDIGGSGNSRGRDNFNGRQGFLPSKTQSEKWKHDLYQDVNKDPIPQNEDDQIAKLEALLAS